jgi:hypothetical protein
MRNIIRDEQVAANTTHFIDECLRKIKGKQSGYDWYNEEEIPSAIIAAAIIYGCNEIARAIRGASK